MTDHASVGPPARRTRRQLLVGGTGALAAVLTGEALARSAPAAAADGDPVILGQDNTTTNGTSITNDFSGDNAFALEVAAFGATTAVGLSGVSDSGTGVRGAATSGDGVHGLSTSGNGVSGASGKGIGVSGVSGGTLPAVTVGYGISGVTASVSGAGVIGENPAGGVGVLGNSAGGVGVSGIASGGGTGVAGAGGPNGGDGVSGISNTGNGVSGFSDTGPGVFGVNSGPSAAVIGANSGSGIGVKGECTAGIGVLAQGATALSVAGRAVFSHSGVLTIAAGKSSATKTRVALTPASLVLATAQQDQPGVWVRSAVPHVSGRSFTVHLSKPAPTRTSVAWFVVN